MKTDRLLCIFVWAISALMFCFSDVAASDRYVSRYTGRDTTLIGTNNDCTNPSAPCRTIQHAIDEAGWQPGSRDEIKVTTGTYSEHLSIVSNGVSVNIDLLISGGWDTGFTQRGSNPQFTLIDGSYSGRVLFVDADANSQLAITVSGFTLRRGSDDRGGAIRILSQNGADAEVEIVNSIIKENRAWYDGGGIYAANYFANSTLSLNIEDSVISDNTCAYGTNTYISDGGALSTRCHDGTLSVVISNSTFEGNSATQRGGALYFYSQNDNAVTTVEANRNQFIGNEIDRWGVIDLYSKSSGVINAVFTNNLITESITGNIDGFFLESEDSGAIDFDLTNNTITGNKNGISCDGRNPQPAGYFPIKVDSYNNILWGNSWYDLRIDDRTVVNVGYTDIGVVELGLVGFEGVFNDRGGNIDVNPAFFDAVNGDYHLKNDSPAVDSGICGSLGLIGGRVAPLVDFESEPRPDPGDLDCTLYRQDQFGRLVCVIGTYRGCDMGADEYMVSGRNALIALYNSTNGATWSERCRENWLGPIGTEDTWYGVSTDAFKTDVTSLYLENCNLKGPLPPEIGNLSDLRTLYLRNNQLSGSLPAELGQLTKLGDLNLFNNQIVGSIPTEIGNLVNLLGIELRSNQLSGTIPASIGNLTELLGLNLQYNQLSGGIPAEIGNLANLQELDLSKNQLNSSIPTELGNLANLLYLRLYSNQLSGNIPSEFGNLSNLQDLSLYNNQLTGIIPSMLGSLLNLSTLDLSRNQLSGAIPSEIGNLLNLRSLSLGYNKLVGSIPVTLGNLGNLETLSMGDNQLEGAIPPEIGNLTNLRALSIYSNEFSGSIPIQICDLSNLEELRLYDNQLGSSIPTQIANLTKLRRLELSSNSLSGSIPEGITTLVNLEVLSLCGNQLTGKIPSAIGNLTNLKTLSLCYNELSGLIPTGIGKLTDLESLYLHANKLEGPIPEELGNLVNLRNLDCSENQLMGQIPSQLINLVNLVDNQSDFRWNHLFTNDDELRAFLNTKQRYGDWESHQSPPFTWAMPWVPMLLLGD